MPTSLLAIATKALEENYFFQVPDTEASTFEEPGAIIENSTPGSVRGRFGQLAVLPRCAHQTWSTYPKSWLENGSTLESRIAIVHGLYCLGTCCYCMLA